MIQMTNSSYSHKAFLVSAALVFTAAACSPSNTTDAQTPSPPTNPSSTQNNDRTLTIDEFAEIITNESDQYAIVNVHIPYEGEVAETDMQIPYNDIEALTSALPDKNAPIILYCRSGRMSEEASLALRELGYTQVWDVPGGMNAWRESGHELLNSSE
jgi:rhodanese-related sulfurtransferase